MSPALRYLQDRWEEPPEEYPEWLQEVEPAEQEIPLDEEPDFEVYSSF